MHELKKNYNEKVSYNNNTYPCGGSHRIGGGIVKKHATTTAVVPEFFIDLFQYLVRGFSANTVAKF